jgi:hypothetical protein
LSRVEPTQKLLAGRNSEKVHATSEKGSSLSIHSTIYRLASSKYLLQWAAPAKKGISPHCTFDALATTPGLWSLVEIENNTAVVDHIKQVS